MIDSNDLGPSYNVLHSLDHNTSMHPPYLQRSISAPAIAEHVSDALLPNYEEFDETHIDTGSSFYSELPSRLNPRMPKPVRALHHNDNASGDIGFEPNGFFEDGIHQNMLTSLIMEAKAMTPVDKIQEDFPSTPSAVYSTRLSKITEVPNEHDFAEDESNDMISIPLNSGATSSDVRLRDDHNITSPVGHNLHTIAPSPHIDLSIDQATLSLQNMYVSNYEDSNNLRNNQNGGIGNVSGGGVNVGLGYRPMNANNMNISLNNNHMQVGNQQQQQPQQSLHYMNNSNTQLNGTSINTTMNLNTLSNNTMMTNNTPLQSVIHSNELPHYLRQQPQLQLQPNMGTNILSQQVQYQDPMNQLQQQPHLIHIPPQQAQQAQYFIQQNTPMMNMNISNQPLYVDSNSQNVYYRLDPTTGLYQNDNTLLYTNPIDGVPLQSVNTLMTDPLSQQSQQQQSQQLQQGQQQPTQVYNPYLTNPTTTYWPNTNMMTNDPSQIIMMTNNATLPPLTGTNNNSNRDNMIARRVMTQQQQQQPYPQQQLQVQGQPMMARGYPNQSQLTQQQLSQQQQPPQYQNMNRGNIMIPGTTTTMGNNLSNNLPMKTNPNQMIQTNNNNINNNNPNIRTNNHMMLNVSNMQNPMIQNNNGMLNGNGGVSGGGIGYGMDDNNLMDLDMQNRMLNNLHQDLDLHRMNDTNGMMMNGMNNNNNNMNNNQNMNHNGNNNNNSRNNNNNNNRMDRNDKNHNNNRNNNNGNNNNNKNNNSNNNNQNNNQNNNNAVPTPVRDPLVEDFRNTYGKSRQWELKDLIGHVVPFCQDQHGSRFIQQRLEVASDADKQIIFDEVMPTAHSLMTDVFGNYVIQKLFEYGAPDQCEALASLLTGHAVGLALQMYGCRVIQKALEYVNTARLVTLVQEFEGAQVLRCVHDQNGNHVIQKCIEVVSRVAKEAPVDVAEYLSSRILFIIQSFQGRVRELSMHPYGCRVVQRILEHCTNSQKACLLEELRLCCIELVQDQYGNYVIQHVMQHGWETDRAILIKEVQEHLLEFSQHKFASNVVEKCLQYSNKKDRDEMIWTIIKVTFDLNNPVDAKTGHCVLENMVRDPYANYVVQKVIDVSDERQRGAIIRYVRENIVQLRRYTYGKHIIVRLEKVSGEKF